MAMDQPMFGVLGSLEVRLAEDSVRLGGPKPRMLLATLLLNPAQVVGTDVLTEVLWPDRRPRSAAANLRTYVSTLRKQLAAGPARIHALGTGYMIELPPDELDLLLFEERVAAAEASQHRPAESAALLEQALA